MIWKIDKHNISFFTFSKCGILIYKATTEKLDHIDMHLNYCYMYFRLSWWLVQPLVSNLLILVLLLSGVAKYIQDGFQIHNH